MKPIYTKNRTIGLLGGSFNPAHGGHLHITLYALKKLGIDEVWWLVSPHNPLKSESSLAPYAQRLASARQMAENHPRIRVLDIEAKLGTHYSFETITALQAQNPGAHFVWMMGADNLAVFHRWRRWQQIRASLPLIIFDRAPYSHTSLRSKTYLSSRRFLLKTMDIGERLPAPGVVFVHLRRDTLSSTFLRKKLGKGAFLAHNKNAGSF